MKHDEYWAKRIIEECSGRGDIESSHAKADELLCDLLKSLGYHETVKAFDELDKWYA